MLSPGTAVVARPDAIWNQVDTEFVILDTHSGKFFSTGPVGGAVWRMLETPQTLDQLCVSVAGQFEVDAQSCARDVGAFVESLLAAGLAELATPA